MTTSNTVQLLAQGIYGYVYRGYFGSLPSHIKIKGPYVTKITTSNQAIMEFRHIQSMRHVDPRNLFTVPVDLATLSLSNEERQAVALKYDDPYIEDTQWQLIMQYDGPDLKKYLLANQSVPRSINKQPDIIFQKMSAIFHGLLEMKRRGLIHGDIKLSNITVGVKQGPHSTYRLIDYGNICTVEEYVEYYLSHYDSDQCINGCGQIPDWVLVQTKECWNDSLDEHHLSLTAQWVGYYYTGYFYRLRKYAQSIQSDKTSFTEVLTQLAPYADFYLLAKTIVRVLAIADLHKHDLSPQQLLFLRCAFLPITEDNRLVDMSQFVSIFSP